jgi:hypothetical protein
MANTSTTWFPVEASEADRSEENDDIVSTAKIDMIVTTISISTSEKAFLSKGGVTLRAL